MLLINVVERVCQPVQASHVRFCGACPAWGVQMRSETILGAETMDTLTEDTFRVRMMCERRSIIMS